MLKNSGKIEGRYVEILFANDIVTVIDSQPPGYWVLFRFTGAQQDTPSETP